MLLWTIQNADAYENMKKVGVLRANDNYIFMDFNPTAYHWMANKLEAKCPKPDCKMQYPVWAWYMKDGKRKRRDLRCAGYGKRGEEMVQITIEVPNNQVLLSDFDAFHFVLSDLYLPTSEEDSLRFESDLKNDSFTWGDLQLGETDNDLKKTYREKVVDSWEKIFDLEREDDYVFCDIQHKSIQAVMWQVTMEQVLKVEHFKAK